MGQPQLGVLVWHLHGAWTTALVQGRHRYVIPTQPGGGPWGAGKLGRDWPNAVEVPPDRLAGAGVDVVVLQRPRELDLVRRWLRREPGTDVPAVYAEHNAPPGPVPDARHPVADRPDIPLVHVTHFNELMWDSGLAPTTVIEHGVVDPGYRYRGDLARAAVVVNEPARRWRTTGTDLWPAFTPEIGLDVFGMGLDRLDTLPGVTPVGDLPTTRLHAEMARRRLYLHPVRWTSLGLSLIEAMQLGMPVVALATTEAARAVPPEAGVISTRVADLVNAARELVADPARCRQLGKQAREVALARYGLPRFLSEWDAMLADVRQRW